MVAAAGASTTAPLPARVRQRLVAGYAVLRLVLVCGLVGPVFGGIDDAIAETLRLSVAALTLSVALVLTIPWAYAARSTTIPGSRPWVARLGCVDQLLFTVLACVLGGGYGEGALAATVAPPIIVAIAASFEMAVELALLNAASLAAAYTLLPQLELHPLSPPRGDWPVFAALGLLYTIPAWMIGRMIDTVETVRADVVRDAQAHLEELGAARQAANVANHLHDVLHTNAVGGLELIARSLKSRTVRRCLAELPAQADAARALVAQCEALANRIRDNFTDATVSAVPAPRRHPLRTRRRPASRWRGMRVFVAVVRRLSRRLDWHLAALETRLPHPGGWTVGDYRHTQRASGAAGVVAVYDRRFWRLLVQVRVIWAALLIPWAVTYGSSSRQHALDGQIVVGAALLGAWTAATTAWSTYLRDQLLKRRWVSLVEVVFGAILLGLGGGVDSAFVGYSGLTMVLPAMALGTAGLLVAWAMLVAAFPLWFFVYDVFGGDPLVHAVAPWKGVVENALGYTGEMVMLLCFLFVLGLFRRIAAVETRLIDPERKRWVTQVETRLRRLEMCRHATCRERDDCAADAVALLEAIQDRVPVARVQLTQALRLLGDVDDADDHDVMVTLGEVLEDTRAALVFEGIDRFGDVDIVLTWDPEAWAPRFILDSRHVGPVRQFVREAVHNMARHGRPPCHIHVRVRLAPEWYLPSAKDSVEIMFSNELAPISRRSGGLGTKLLREYADRIGGELIEPLKTEDGRWTVGLRFAQPALSSEIT